MSKTPLALAAIAAAALSASPVTAAWCDCLHGDVTPVAYPGGGSIPDSGLTGAWTYNGVGRAVIEQTGDRVSLRLTYTPNKEPGPHYIVETTKVGRSLDGFWRCRAKVCRGQGGKFHAVLTPDGNAIQVSQTEDQGGNSWNRVKLIRSYAVD